MRKSLLLAPLVALAGCPSDPDEERITFSEATPAQIERGIDAAVGGDLSMALMAGQFFAEADPEGACPHIELDGTTLTATTGCTWEPGLDAVALEGTVVIEQYERLLTDEWPDDELVVTMTFDDLLAVDDGTPVAIDGTLVFDARSGLHGDLTVELAGIAVHSEVALGCSDAAGCDRDEDSTISIEGLGSATATGDADLFGDVDGVVTLEGAETLTVDFSGDGECAPYEIDGEASGEYCATNLF